jgi:hypothetical protein
MPKKDKVVFEDKQRRIGKRTRIVPVNARIKNVREMRYTS